MNNILVVNTWTSDYRQIEAEHERETQELQKCWTDLRTLIRTLYGADDPTLSEDDGVKIKELVGRLVLSLSKLICTCL